MRLPSDHWLLMGMADRSPPLSSEERATKAKVEIRTHFNSKQQVFPDFVLSHCFTVGMEELEQLTPLPRLKYLNSIHDAVADLRDDIGLTFTGFQMCFYQAVA